jgi:hypothetical protein
MFLHNTKMMHTVRVDEPNPAFAKLLLEQFGGPNGELAAAMRYFLQGWNEVASCRSAPPPRRSVSRPAARIPLDTGTPPPSLDPQL